MKNIFHSERFQGSITKKDYFEGWYFKMVSSDNCRVVSIIPGISLQKDDPHAFIQVISTELTTPLYIRYPLASFSSKKEAFYISIGKSTFSSDHLHLDIDFEEGKISGDLNFYDQKYLPQSLLSPSIMGWFAYLPHMECNHGVISMHHRIEGALSIETKEISFDKGIGYIEKDWGTSFPSSWIWLHANTGDSKEFSFLFSYATIPIGKRGFNGLICFLYVEGKFYRFATYNRASIETLTIGKKRISIRLKRKNLTLTIVATNADAGKLQAPVKGKMDREIYESITAQISLTLIKDSGEVLYTIEGAPGGYEVSGFEQ